MITIPNWVFCNLTVSGTAEQVAMFDKEMKQPHPTFVPKEDDKWGHKDGECRMTETEEFSFWNAVAPTDLVAYFTGDAWYNWNIANWGCKWDVNVEDEDLWSGKDGSTNKTYRFDTAWSPPTEVFVALCAKYPELNLTLGYEEEQGWGGELQSDEEGGCFESESYDIPSSHADMVERGREDCCNCMTEDEEYWYDDCPREEEDETKVIIVENLTSLVVS